MTTTLAIAVAAAAVAAATTFAAMLARLAKARQGMVSAEEHARQLAERDAANARLVQAKEEECRRRLADKDAEMGRFMQTMRSEFAALAAQQLKTSAEGLTELNERRVGELVRPLRDTLAQFNRSFQENTQQQVANKASFDQAIRDLGDRAMKIGAEAENLAKALKSESKTQGDWGEMVLGNILTAAGLTEGIDFLQQEQETDAEGNRLIPDVEIVLPGGEKLLVDSKASVTAYLNYVAATDDETRKRTIREHVESVRKHMNELAEKDYDKKVKGSQGYVLMFIPNEGSYLLAMEHDRKLATDAFKRHVIIVNPTTLLLCLQIVALLRAREAQDQNAEKIAQAAASLYEKFAGFTESFTEIGKKLGDAAKAYDKAKGQLCEGKGNFVLKMEQLKGMGVGARTSKRINPHLLTDQHNQTE